MFSHQLTTLRPTARGVHGQLCQSPTRQEPSGLAVRQSSAVFKQYSTCKDPTATVCGLSRSREAYARSLDHSLFVVSTGYV